MEPELKSKLNHTCSAFLDVAMTNFTILQNKASSVLCALLAYIFQNGVMISVCNRMRWSIIKLMTIPQGIHRFSLITEVKPCRAGLVLGWVTTLEHYVL